MLMQPAKKRNLAEIVYAIWPIYETSNSNIIKESNFFERFSMTKQISTDRATIVSLLADYSHYLVLVVALVATLGSLIFSEVLRFEPCRLCWFQRIAMYPIVVLALVGVIKQDEYLPNYVLPLSAIGICISIYHILIQNGVALTSTGCTTALCSIKYINWLGFISIPVLAGTAFLLINILMIIGLRWGSEE